MGGGGARGARRGCGWRLSLAGHPDPARFAAGFSGTDRTVAEYLLAEVLDRQPAAVRRLLLRTSILERVNGELADLLTTPPWSPRSGACSPGQGAMGAADPMPENLVPR